MRPLQVKRRKRKPNALRRRVSLAARLLRGQGKGRARGWVPARIVRQKARRTELAQLRSLMLTPYPRAELLAARAQRKAHTWFTTERRACR